MLSTEEPESIYSAFCSLLRCKVTPRQGQVLSQNSKAMDLQAPQVQALTFFKFFTERCRGWLCP